MAENLLLKFLKRTPRVRIEKLPDVPATGVKIKEEKKDNDTRLAAPAASKTTTLSPVSQNSKPTASSTTTTNSTNLLKEKITNGPASFPQQTTVPPIDESSIDFASICGKFGWVAIGDDCLPVILRGDKQFVAVRIVESEIISKYTKVLPWHVFTSTNIKSYYVTENEAKLLNEINDYHSDRRYGYTAFTIKDVVVTVLDATRFHEYLHVCKYKLFPEKTLSQDRYRNKCGLLNISGRIIAPYVRKKGIKYIPQIFLTDGLFACETSVEMEDWDVAYLKFVCHVAALDAQKVKAGFLLYPINELQDYLTGQKVVVEDKAFSGASPLEYTDVMGANWLQQQKNDANNMAKHLSSQVLSSSNCASDLTKAYWNAANTGNSQTVSERLQFARTNKSNFTDNGQQESASYYHEKSPSRGYMDPPMRKSPSSGSNHRGGSILKYFAPTNSLGNSNLFPPPPPLVRTGRQLSSGGGHHNSSMNAVATSESALAGLGRPAPPPLQPSSNPVIEAARNNQLNNLLSNAHSLSAASLNGFSGLPDTFLGYPNGSLSAKNSMPRTLNGVDEANKAARRLLSGSMVIPPHHYPTPPQSSPLQASTTPTPLPIGLLDAASLGHPAGLLAHSDLVDFCSPPPSPDSRKLMSNYANSGSHGMQQQLALPHFLQHVELDGKVVSATNLEPYKFHSTLVTSLATVQKLFFPNTSLQSCQFVLKNVLGVKLYSASGLLLMTLTNQGSSTLMVDAVIAMTDLQCYLPHLTYMFQNHDAQTVVNLSSTVSGSVNNNASPKKARLDFSLAEN